MKSWGASADIWERSKGSGEHMWVSDTPTLPLGYYYDLFCSSEPGALIYLLPGNSRGKSSPCARALPAETQTWPRRAGMA